MLYINRYASNLLRPKLFYLFSERPISEEEAERFAKDHGISDYVECSALTQKNLKEVFDTSLLKAINFNHKKTKKKSWRRKRKDSLRSSKRISTHSKSIKWWRKYLCL